VQNGCDLILFTWVYRPFLGITLFFVGLFLGVFSRFENIFRLSHKPESHCLLGILMRNEKRYDLFTPLMGLPGIFNPPNFTSSLKNK
jgi:site-specific recombinase